MTITEFKLLRTAVEYVASLPLGFRTVPVADLTFDFETPNTEK